MQGRKQVNLFACVGDQTILCGFEETCFVTSGWVFPQLYLPFPDIYTYIYIILTVSQHRMILDSRTQGMWDMFAALHFSEGSEGRQQNCGSAHNDWFFRLHLADWFPVTSRCV